MPNNRPSDSPIESTKGLHESKERKPGTLTQEEIAMLRTDILTCVNHMLENPVVKGWPALEESWVKVKKDFTALLENLRVGLSRGAEPEIDLDQRFALKESVVRLRKMVADKTSVWLPSNLPTDVEAVLDEIDRLMLVNGQIARMLCDAQDRVAPPRGEAETPTERDVIRIARENHPRAQGEPLFDSKDVEALSDAEDFLWDSKSADGARIASALSGLRDRLEEITALSPRGDDGTAKALKQEQKHEG